MSSPSESACFGGQTCFFPSSFTVVLLLVRSMKSLSPQNGTRTTQQNLGVFPLLRLPFSKSLCKRKPPSLASDAYRVAMLVIWFDHA